MTSMHESHPYARYLLRLALIVAIVVMAVAPAVYAEIIIPANSTTAFIQTTGLNAPLGIGDYHTNVAGDNSFHDIHINIACTPGQNHVYEFQLFDPAIDPASNPPGVFFDEQRGAADTTFFELITPGGASIAQMPYLPGTSDAAWTTLMSIPVTSIPGNDCGTYHLHVRTSNDDDNGWRFRLLGNPDPITGVESFDPAVGPDGVPGTGDESWLGILNVSYEHSPAGCQNFYWFVPDGATNLFMLNFDLDASAFGGVSVAYHTPGGANITGTASNSTTWNDAPAQQTPRPAYALMSTFDVAGGDLAGDATPNPEPGLWQATVCVGIDNQYSFEVPGYQIYLDPPILPEVLINKDDGVTIVGTPGSTTYTLTITNTTQAAAMPIPGPEVVDTLPVGMSFVSCAVNPPLVGTCAESAPGSNIVNVQLGAQSATIPAYLPGTDAAPNNVGTMTISANVAPGLAAGTALTNTASVDWTDVFGNDYPPVSDDDIDTVISLPTTADVSVVKTDQPDPVMPGGVLTYTLVISNAGPANAANVVVTDTLPAGVTFASAVPAQTSGPNPLTWNLGTVAAETRRTITVVVNVNPSAQCAIMNTASVSSTTPDPNPGNNGDDEPTAVSGADLQISKSDNPDPVASGAVLTYTLLITNAGPAAAQSVVVTDALPAGVTFANANPAPSSLGNPLTWNLGNMVSGARQTITVVVDVDPATSGQILNTTRVSSTAPDCDPGNNADNEPTTVRPSTAVELLYFRVNSVDNPQVHVGWATAAEIDNFGFKLYRAPVDDFSRGQLIHFEPSSIGGAGPGATYEYVDSVPAEGVWWYWLADLDTQGVETVHGPISAGVGAAALPHRVFVPLILRVP